MVNGTSLREFGTPRPDKPCVSLTGCIFHGTFGVKGDG
jgi:hypothetical protein